MQVEVILSKKEIENIIKDLMEEKFNAIYNKIYLKFIYDEDELQSVKINFNTEELVSINNKPF